MNIINDNERYNFTWNGKQKAKKIAQTVYLSSNMHQNADEKVK